MAVVIAGKQSGSAGNGGPICPRRRVMYVDYAVGFGGATKSLSLVFRGLPATEKTIVTCQEDHVIRQWYDGIRVRKFRGLANYRTYWAVMRWFKPLVRARAIRFLILKFLAVIDLSVSVWHAVRLVWFVKRFRIDCVHLNNGYGPLEGMLAARITGIPCVVHMRGMMGAPGRINLGAARGVARSIAVSRAVAESVRAHLDTQIEVIHDPVDLDLFERSGHERDPIRRKLEIGPDEVAVGIFGRVVRWKGQLEFVRACAAAMKRDPRLRPVIVGDPSDGEVSYFHEVEHAVRASEFADRFIFTGYRPEVAGLYHAMDIVVHASIEPEPFGMVVPEAMAARRPVIASAAGGPCEVIEDGVDGLLVPPGDTAALCEAIVELAGAPARRRAMGEKGRSKVHARFGISIIAEQVEAVYRDVVDTRRPT